MDMSTAPAALVSQGGDGEGLEQAGRAWYFVLDAELPLHDTSGVFHVHPCCATPARFVVGVAACHPLCDLLFAALRLVGVWDIPEEILRCERSKAAFVQQRGLAGVRLLATAQDKTRKTRQQVLILEAGTHLDAQNVCAHFDGCAQWGSARPTARPLLSCADELEPAWDVLASGASAGRVSARRELRAPRGAAFRPDPLCPLWIAPDGGSLRSAAPGW